MIKKDLAVRSVGIVGLGDFGTYLASRLDPFCSVVGFDVANHDSPVRRAPLADLAKSDLVVLCVPLASYPAVLSDLRDNIGNESVLMDTCSVKSVPERLIAQILPQQTDVLLTHPLFGPQSGAAGTAGLSLFVTLCRGDRAGSWIDRLQVFLDTKIEFISADDHDQLMAEIQALTFFVGRALRDIGLAGHRPISTESFEWLQGLARLENFHSEALFATIQNGNSYASGVRKRMLAALKSIEQNLSS